MDLTHAQMHGPPLPVIYDYVSVIRTPIDSLSLDTSVLRNSNSILSLALTVKPQIKFECELAKLT